MIKVSFVIPILMVLSVLVLAQAMERVWALFLQHPLPTKIFNAVKIRLEKGDRAGAVGICDKSDTIIGEAFSRMLRLPQPTTEAMVEAFQLYRQRLHIELNRRLGFFGTISFIAPLIGLTGTVLGIMRAFHDLAAAGAGGPAVVAAGISEALIATAAGIGLATVSAILYNYFTLSVRHRMSVMDLWVFELAQLLEKDGGT